MERRTLGKTGLSVSVLGFGGAEIGFEEATPDAVSRLLNGALDAGLNVIDTAAMYRTSEELIGNAVGHRRKDYVLLTKCAHPVDISRPDWRAEAITDSIDRSLRLLRTDVLDVVFLHSCGEALLRGGDYITRLQRARVAGKVRFLGYSGDGAAMSYAIECGAFDVIQTSINVFDQEAVELTLPLLREQNLGVVAKRPIGNAVWRYADRPENSYHHTYYDRMRALGYRWCADPERAAETALRFTLGLPGVHTMIVGTKNPDRWQDNARLVAKGPLSATEYELIRSRWKQVAGSDWLGQM